MKRQYQVTFRETDDNMIEINAEDDGFNGFEIMGLMEVKMRDIYNQIMHPEIFKHTRVVKTEDGTYKKIEEKETNHAEN